VALNLAEGSGSARVETLLLDELDQVRAILLRVVR